MGNGRQKSAYRHLTTGLDKKNKRLLETGSRMKGAGQNTYTHTSHAPPFSNSTSIFSEQQSCPTE